MDSLSGDGRDPLFQLSLARTATAEDQEYSESVPEALSEVRQSPRSSRDPSQGSPAMRVCGGAVAKRKRCQIPTWDDQPCALEATVSHLRRASWHCSTHSIRAVTLVCRYHLSSDEWCVSSRVRRDSDDHECDNPFLKTHKASFLVVTFMRFHSSGHTQTFLLACV